MTTPEDPAQGWNYDMTQCPRHNGSQVILAYFVEGQGRLQGRRIGMHGRATWLSDEGGGQWRLHDTCFGNVFHDHAYAWRYPLATPPLPQHMRAAA